MYAFEKKFMQILEAYYSMYIYIYIHSFQEYFIYIYITNVRIIKSVAHENTFHLIADIVPPDDFLSNMQLHIIAIFKDSFRK